MPITTTTVAKFRATTSAPTAEAYELVEPGKSGRFYYDEADKTTADNGGTVLVNKKGHRLKRDFSGPPLASWFDIRPGQDVSAALQRYVDSLPGGEYVAPLVLEAGRYSVSKTVDLGRTGLGLLCLTGRATWINKGKGPFLRWGNGRPVKLCGLSFSGPGYRELTSPAGERIIDAADPLLYQHALVIAGGVCNISECTFEETPGHGLVLEGWLPASNVSGSRIHTQNLFQRCGGRGLHIVGADANAVVVDGANDFRDNAGGLCDQSLLGGLVLGDMFHNNPLGHVQLTGGGGSMAVVAFSYEEGDSAPDVLSGQSLAIGNRHSGAPQVGEYATLMDPNSPFVSGAASFGTQFLRAKNSAYPLLEVVKSGEPVRRWNTDDERRFPFDVLNVPHLLVDGHLVDLPVASLAAALRLDCFFQPGDTIFSRADSRRYVCVRGGNGGRVLAGVTATVTPNSGGQLVVSGDTDQLEPGSVVEVGGHVVPIQYLSHDVNNGLRAIGPYDIRDSVASQPLSYPAPQFQPLA